MALPQHLFEVMQLVNQAGEVHLMVEIHPAAQQLFNQHLNSGQSIAISDAYKAMQGIDTGAVLPADPMQLPAGMTASMHHDKLLGNVALLIRQIRDELKLIAKLKREHAGDKAVYRGLIAREVDLRDRLQGSQERGIQGLLALDALLKKGDPSLSDLQVFFEQDMQRMATLMSRRTVEDIREASRILDFYIQLGTFDRNREHPLFLNDEIYDTQGNLLLPPGTVKYLQKLRAQAEQFKIVVDSEARSKVSETINEDPRVQQYYGRMLTQEEIFANVGGLTDITFLDQMIMDPTNGIFTSGHVITQKMMMLLNETVDGKVKEADVLIRELDAIQKEVEEELKRQGHSYSLPFVKGVSWAIFFAKDKNGFDRGDLIQRFTAEWEDQFEDAFRRMQRQVANAQAEPSAQKRDMLIQQAHEDHCRWLEEHTVMVHPEMLAELVADPDFAPIFGAHAQVNDAHRQELIDLLGPRGYDEMLARQRKRLNAYLVERELLAENLMANEGVSQESQLSASSQKAIQDWERKNSPTQIGQELMANTKHMPRNPRGSEYQFCHFVPRKTRMEWAIGLTGMELQDTGRSTGFYDAQFAQIESNPILFKAYGVFRRMLEHASDNLPPEVQEQLGREMSLPQMRKTLVELLMDENLHGLAKISAVLRRLLENFKRLFSEDFNDSVSYAHIDPFTGKPEYHVNTSWLRSNKAEMQQRMDTTIIQLQNFLPDIRRHRRYSLHHVPQEVLMIIAEQAGCEPTVASIQRKFPNSDMYNFDLKGELRAVIMHTLVQEQSLDLPKLLRLHTHLAAAYGARREALPLLTMMKRYYERIPKRKTNMQGQPMVSGVHVDAQGNPIPILDGERKRANEQLDAWFHRVVLGQFGAKHELGDTSFITSQSHGGHGFFHRLTGRVYTDKDKRRRAEIDKALDALGRRVPKHQDEANDIARQVDRLRKQRGMLGSRVTPVSIMNALFQWVRLIGLGWNYKSAFTNYLEGQLSNMYAAMAGTYFTPENIYRANMIVRKSTIKMVTGGKLASKEAKKLAALMARFNVLQDSSNELQRASKRSFLNKASVLDPYELTRRVEYKNQAPIMLAILFDRNITDVNGQNPVTVWDAMDEEGNLKPEYRTPENVATWEQCGTQEYREFSTKVTKAIVNIHGDYHELRGMQATDYMLGKALLMFKRWSARWVFTHWAKEQDDIETGVRVKGSVKSMTAATAGLMGGAIGFMALGPVGMLVAGAGGLLVGKLYGPRTDLNIIHDLLLQTIDLGKMLFRIPLNFMLGKNIIKHETDQQLLQRHGAVDSAGQTVSNGPGFFKQIDAQNYRRSIAELATLVMLVMLKMVVKGMLDDDDDEDEKRWRNASVNQLMQMTDQLQTIMNPKALYESYFSNMSVLRHLDNMRKTVGAMLDDDPNNPAGPRAKKLFFPFFSRLESSQERQFHRDYTDNPEAFWGVASTPKERERLHAEAAKAIRQRYRLFLIEQGVTDEKKLQRLVNRRFRPAKKGESKEHLRQAYEAVERSME